MEREEERKRKLIYSSSGPHTIPCTILPQKHMLMWIKMYSSLVNSCNRVMLIIWLWINEQNSQVFPKESRRGRGRERRRKRGREWARPHALFIFVCSQYFSQNCTHHLFKQLEITIQNIVLTFEHTVLATHIYFFSGNSFIHLFIETWLLFGSYLCLKLLT